MQWSAMEWIDGMQCSGVEWNGCILALLVILGPFWVIFWRKKRHFKMSYLWARFVGSSRPTNSKLNLSVFFCFVLPRPIFDYSFCPAPFLLQKWPALLPGQKWPARPPKAQFSRPRLKSQKSAMARSHGPRGPSGPTVLGPWTCGIPLLGTREDHRQNSPPPV